MDRIVRIEGESSIEVPLHRGKSLLEHIREAGVYINAPCSGIGKCGKCVVKILEGKADVTEQDKEFLNQSQLDAGYRLACCFYPEESCFVEIPDSGEEKMESLKDYKVFDFEIEPIVEVKKSVNLESLNDGGSFCRNIEKIFGRKIEFSLEALKDLSKIMEHKDKSEKELYFVMKNEKLVRVSEKMERVLGLALDLGTTTIAMKVIDLESGAEIASARMINEQRKYGADVISRIAYSNENGILGLKKAAINSVLSGIKEILNTGNLDKSEIYEMSVSGNTVMLHLLMGISCRSIGVIPFTSITLEKHMFEFREIFESSMLECNVHILPSISAYVGADILSGIYAYDMIFSNKPCILIDLGTNGEMVVGSRDGIVTTATAAGPAFEGGNIKCGIGSVAGAISRVEYLDGRFVYETIGGKKAKGLCGTGLIDAAASLVKSELMDYTGYFSQGEYFEIGEGVGVYQKDMRELQLAKSAIRAGLSCLVEEYGCTFEDVEKVYVAGGFGTKVNLESLVEIGLLPEVLLKKAIVIGNSSLAGAVRYLLDKSVEEKMAGIKSKTRDINLGESPEFNNYFMLYMYFERN